MHSVSSILTWWYSARSHDKQLQTWGIYKNLQYRCVHARILEMITVGLPFTETCVLIWFFRQTAWPLLMCKLKAMTPSLTAVISVSLLRGGGVGCWSFADFPSPVISFFSACLCSRSVCVQQSTYNCLWATGKVDFIHTSLSAGHPGFHGYLGTFSSS